MSIDAIVEGVRYEDDGTATLVLGPRGPLSYEIREHDVVPAMRAKERGE